MITLGTAMVAAPFFNSFLSKMPYFLLDDAELNNAKDRIMTIISQSTTIAKDLLSDNNPDKWTAEKQDEFSNYMGQSTAAWGNITEKSQSKLFDGSDDSLNHLTDLISDGRLIEGKGMAPPGPDAPAESASALRASISKAFLGFAIPSIWTVSGTYAFNIDSGYDCCYGGKLHYLASSKGDASTCTEGGCFDNKFSTPPGIDSLDGKDSGGITVGDLITGSVRTYQQNGNQNGGAAADPATAGHWRTSTTRTSQPPASSACPCAAPTLPSRPGTSPEGHTPTWPTTHASRTRHPTTAKTRHREEHPERGRRLEVENAIGNQHQLVQFGSCAFGVQGQGKNGNVDFNISA
ncbi:hypothetical protein IFM47457_06365 [Aspergillus lentulus]|nr:hypothetical protein IFM47457_06365 [Aspergillus lentulus]